MQAYRVSNKRFPVILLRHIAKQVYRTMVMTVVTLLLILIINQLVNLLNRAAMGKMTALTVIQAVAIGIPQYLAYMVPLGLFLGLVIALSKMCANHELIAMQAAGYSRAQLLRCVFFISLPVAIFVAYLTFALSPLSRELETAVIKKAVMTASLNKVIPGQFQPLDSGGTVFYSQERVGDLLTDVLLVTPMKKAESDDNPAPIWDVIRAKTASEQEDKNGDIYLQFSAGRRVIMQPGALAAEEFWFDKYAVLLTTPAIHPANSPVNLPTPILYQQLKSGLAYVAEWQWRFSIPLSVIILALIAVPLSQINPRQGKFMRILPAILLYAIYINLLFCSRSWLIAGKLPVGIGLWWVPTLSCLLLLLHWCYGVGKQHLSRRRGRA